MLQLPLEVAPAQLDAVAVVPWTALGITGETNQPLTVQGVEVHPIRVEVEDLRKAWTKTLDW